MADVALERMAAITLADTADFKLGNLHVSPAHRQVRHDGDVRDLEPKVMQVLVALASVRPQVVSRDRLVDLCWGGRIVGDDTLNRCIVALRHLAHDFSPEPFRIETVRGVGYCLVEGPGREAAADTRRKPFSRGAIAVALAILAVVAAFLAVQWWRGGADPAPASMAVLPFRNLGTGDPYLAEGIGEEILGQLAREPGFRVIGRGSSREFGADADVREVGRRLDVDYALEGSVRRQGDRVRVTANLVRTRDAVQLWSESYDGSLDDIFAIQRKIGAAIAGALQRKLVQDTALPDRLETTGEAYTLYLTARSLIRTRNRRAGPMAADLLRDAIRIDPGYAPAWASLAEATQLQGALEDRESFIAALRKSRAYARHALALAPDLAEAHRALGLALDYGDPEGVAHLRRAAALAPNDAENLLGLAGALHAAGEFERQLAVVRRAHELEPLWFRTTGGWALAMAEMGDRAAAEAIARRGLADNKANLHNLLGRIAWTSADYSEAVRHWTIVVRSGSPRWGHTAERTRRDATYAVGISTGALVDVPEAPASRIDWRAWVDSAPAPAEWRKRNRDPLAAGVYRKHNLVAAKLMLNSGRWRELVAVYDSPVGLLGLGPRRRVRVDQVLEAPIVALALRQAGRGGEADRLLREADSAVRSVYSRGRVPFRFDVEAAALFAVQGRSEAALHALERAMERGWRQNSGTSLRNIADEPAFRSLHGEPRFKRLQARIAAHYALERREVEALLRA